ncbi:MAG TPA: nicotinate-nucleotide--dimethylbenzimidazole phosphoribosyltransferase [Candidatus Nanopelagicaceae bacterium]|nr:nicotinate-nucleotide--dimethylbenzimidazole phosphoribosyltransferase [Candidatus Nanopelagicaceae bacterium]
MSIASVVIPSAAHHAQALSRQDELIKPTGALGRLEPLSAWVCAVQKCCPPHHFRKPTLVILAGDHGVSRAGVSAYPSEVTRQMLGGFLQGGSAAASLSRSLGIDLEVFDIAIDSEPDGIPDRVIAHKVRRGSGDISIERALTSDEVAAGIDAGAAIADELIDQGADLFLVGDMGIGNTTIGAALVGVLTQRSSLDVLGRGTGIDDQTFMRKREVLDAAIARGSEFSADPLSLLGEIGGADFAAMVGFLLQSAAREVPTILDGLMTTASALVATLVSPTAAQWWQASHKSTEPAHACALKVLDKEPLIDLDMRLGEGSGALLAYPIIQAAITTLRDMSTFEEAQVSDRG